MVLEIKLKDAKERLKNSAGGFIECIDKLEDCENSILITPELRMDMVI